MRLLEIFYRKISGDGQWDSPLTIMQKPTSRVKWHREQVIAKAGRGGEKTNNDLMPSTHIAERPTTILSIASLQNEELEV